MRETVTSPVKQPSNARCNTKQTPPPPQQQQQQPPPTAGRASCEGAVCTSVCRCCLSVSSPHSWLLASMSSSSPSLTGTRTAASRRVSMQGCGHVRRVCACALCVHVCVVCACVCCVCMCVVCVHVHCVCMCVLCVCMCVVCVVCVLCVCMCHGCDSRLPQFLRRRYSECR